MKEKKFEQALQELETIVHAMEAGELSLDESLQKYEEGIKLSHFCKSKLEAAEKKIEILQKRADGSVAVEDFDKAESDESDTAAEPVSESTAVPVVDRTQPVASPAQAVTVPSEAEEKDVPVESKSSEVMAPEEKDETDSYTEDEPETDDEVKPQSDTQSGTILRDYDESDDEYDTSDEEHEDLLF